MYSLHEWFPCLVLPRAAWGRPSAVQAERVREPRSGDGEGTKVGSNTFPYCFSELPMYLPFRV